MRRFLLAALLWLIPALALAQPAIDGTPQHATNSSTSISVTVTASANTCITAVLTTNTTSTTTVSGGGLTWSSSISCLSGGGAASGTSCTGNPILFATALAPSGLSGATITATHAGGSAFNSFSVFAVSGADTSICQDPNASLPGAANTGNLSLSTTRQKTLIWGAYRQGGSTCVPNVGWTAITTGDFMCILRQTFTSPQTNSTPTYVGDASNGGIGSALAAVDPVTGRSRLIQ